MPEKVTSLNVLKVTSEYWSYNHGAHNLSYVKFTKYNVLNQFVTSYLPLTFY